MARFSIAAMIATALLLGTTAAAQASSAVHPPRSARQSEIGKLAGRGPVALATAVAEGYWDAVPCAGQVTVLTNLPVPSGLQSETDGWVTFDSSLGENDLEAPADTYTRCTISLAHWQWPTQQAMMGDWNMFCLTVTHEMGHLLGHPHSLAPGSVMAPVFTNESNVPQACRRARVAGASVSARRHAR